MRYSLLTIASLTLLTACGGVFKSTKNPNAPDLQKISTPSTLPPEGYALSVWTDSRGCEFISVSGTSWAPKVTQDGNHICKKLASSPTAIRHITDMSIPSVQQISPTLEPTITAPILSDSNDIKRKLFAEGNSVTIINLEPVQNDTNAERPAHLRKSTVQIGSFSEKSNIERAVRRLRSQGYNVVVLAGVGGLNAVQVKNKEGQSTQQLLVAMKNLGYYDAIIL